MNTTGHDRPETFDPRDARALLEDTERSTHREIDIRSDVLLAAWGAAWLVGYLAIWLSTRGQDPYTGPAGWAYAVLGVAMAAAAIVTVLLIVRATAGISGDSSRAGTYYGFAWLVGFGVWQFIMGAVQQEGVSAEVSTLLGAALPALIVAVIYCASAALWDEGVLFVVGVWLAVTTAVAVWTGPSGVSLVLGALGGLGFFVGAVLSHRRRT